MSHSQRCIDSNRFGDGFDCVCEPVFTAADRAALVAQLEAADRAAIETIRKLKSELESAIREQVELKAERDEARAAQSVAAQFNQNLLRDKTRLTEALAAAERKYADVATSTRHGERLDEMEARAEAAEARVRELEAKLNG